VPLSWPIIRPAACQCVISLHEAGRDGVDPCLARAEKARSLSILFHSFWSGLSRARVVITQRSSVQSDPRNAPRSNRLRIRPFLISVVAGPRFEPTTDEFGARTVAVWVRGYLDGTSNPAEFRAQKGRVPLGPPPSLTQGLTFERSPSRIALATKNTRTTGRQALDRRSEVLPTQWVRSRAKADNVHSA